MPPTAGRNYTLLTCPLSLALRAEKQLNRQPVETSSDIYAAVKCGKFHGLGYQQLSGEAHAFEGTQNTFYVTTKTNV